MSNVTTIFKHDLTGSKKLAIIKLGFSQLSIYRDRGTSTNPEILEKDIKAYKEIIDSDDPEGNSELYFVEKEKALREEERVYNYQVWERVKNGKSDKIREDE